MENSSDSPAILLSTMPAGPRARRLAWVVGLLSGLLIITAAPFAKIPLAPVPAFIPIYESVLVISDFITAALLFGQFVQARSRALLVLACAYLFTAGMTVTHALTFPGLFAPTGLLGAGPQSTAWLYMIWHAGFAALVIAYAWLKDTPVTVEAGRVPVVLTTSVMLVLAMVVTLTMLATAGQDALPAIMNGNRYTPFMIFVVSSVWAASLVALAALWWRRPHSLLDVWLMVVMCAWLCDIALSAVLNAGRFDLGFYAGRVYGMLAAILVLMLLLLENGVLYARLLKAHERDQLKAAELAAANVELEAFCYTVSHDLRSPLTTVDGFAHMLEKRYNEKLGPEGSRLIRRILDNNRQMGLLIDDLLAFSKLGRQPMLTSPLRLDLLVQTCIDELRPACAGRQIEFVVDELGDVQGDAPLLKQALVNLLSNAIKYTRNQPSARVEIGSATDADTPGRYYYIRDNGVGFDMRFAGKLFGVFQRLHRAEDYEGTGVGLAIVQRVIQRHGGRIWVDSRPGSGTVFYFTLAAAPPASTNGAAGESQSRTPAGALPREGPAAQLSA